MKTSIYLVVFFTTFIQEVSLAQQVYKDKFAHTFSIVARDEQTGEMAVAVQSHWFSVGTIVSFGKSGVGVVATQSFVNSAYGPKGLELMESGYSAGDALNALVAEDQGKDFRQVAFLDVEGRTAAHTGAKCVDSAGHLNGDNFSVQANMMLNDKVVPAMAQAFKENVNLPLAERMVAVLLAGQLAGGDIRGKQSAVLLVVNGEPVAGSWLDKKIDLRVDDSEEPIVELKRLLKVHRAYEFMNRGDYAVELNDMETALKEYGAAEALFPENLEMKYWKAIALANNGRLEEALVIFKVVFNADNNWREMTKRLPRSGMLTLSDKDLERIFSL